MTHEKNNFGGRAEHPGSDEQMISSMLSGLKRVEAPKDFDFHLKARIANARPADYQRSGLFPILRYAMPLGLFLAVGGGMLLYSSYNAGLSPEVVQQPVVNSSSEPPVTPTSTTVEPNSSSANESTTLALAFPDESVRHTNTDKSLVASDSARSNRRPSNAGNSRDFTHSPGNSADMTVRGAPTPRTPRGMSSLNPMGVDKALEMVDAEARFENGAWVVRSVKANGIADQMGLKAGDRLKAINGMPVTEKTEFQRSFNAATIQVQRGDTTVELGSAKKPN